MRFDMQGQNAINDLKATLAEGERLEPTPYAMQEPTHSAINLRDDEGRTLRLHGSQETLRNLAVDILAALQAPREPRQATRVA